MNRGIYPGSFDPMTNGHLDIITRAAKIVDELIVAVLLNPKKGTGLLSVEERIAVMKEATKHLENVKIDSFSGLLVDFAYQKQARVIIRGLRNGSDFEQEMNMAQINSSLLKGLETVFLMTAPEHAYMSSTAVREIVCFGGEYEAFVPPAVADKLKINKMRGR